MQNVNFWQWAESDPERIAIVEVDGSTISYRQLADRVHQTAWALQASGMRQGDTIATLLRNRSECSEIFLAALNSGWYYVPINYHATPDDVAYVLLNAEARFIIVDEEFAASAAIACDAAGLAPDCRLVVGSVAGFRSLQEFRRGHSALRPQSSTAGQVMQYTSGTTGRPKGVRRPLIDGKTPEMAVREMSWLLTMFGVKPGPGAHLVTAPLYHSAVHSLAHAALHFGQTAVLMDKWSAGDCLELIRRHRVTTTHMVATHFHRLLQLPAEVRHTADVSSLTHVIHGAVPTPVETKRKMLDWWGAVIYEYFGSSEVGGTAVGPQEWLERPGTVGRPFPVSEVHILDEQGQALPPLQVGQVWMRQGEQEFSYYKDPGKTDRAKRGKLIHVGDYGYVDNEGYLFLSGRDSEIIISGGVNIYPAAIEARLLSHPAVRDCGVIGAPSEEYGEEVKAVVVLNDALEPGPEAATTLLEYCRATLSPIDCPRSIDFTPELPRDPSGKLMKPALRARYWSGRERQI
jgi:long-chain acyl-CoA synthetase